MPRSNEIWRDRISERMALQWRPAKMTKL